MSFSQLLAPIVLGITSDKIRIASVMKPAINASQLISVKPNTVRELDPKIVDACDPTPIAPTVCAIVFKVRIAARGLSISSLKLTRFAKEMSFPLVSERTNIFEIPSLFLLSDKYC